MSERPVLGVYASKHSSTAEIAERIAAAMREAGRAAEARPSSEVDDVGKPGWLFSSGPFGAPEDLPTAPTLPVAEKLVKRLGAREHVMFGGRVPPDPGNFVERAMLKKTPPDQPDARGWPAIDAWARVVADQVDGG